MILHPANGMPLSSPFNSKYIYQPQKSYFQFVQCQAWNLRWQSCCSWMVNICKYCFENLKKGYTYFLRHFLHRQFRCQIWSFYKGQNCGQLVHLGANFNEVLKFMCTTTTKEITFVIFLFVQPWRIRMAERDLRENCPFQCLRVYKMESEKLLLMRATQYVLDMRNGYL